MNNELRREILQFAKKCDGKREQRAKLSDFSEKFPGLTEFDLTLNIAYAVRDKLLVVEETHFCNTKRRVRTICRFLRAKAIHVAGCWVTERIPVPPTAIFL